MAPLNWLFSAERRFCYDGQFRLGSIDKEKGALTCPLQATDMEPRLHLCHMAMEVIDMAQGSLLWVGGEHPEGGG
jgi:hypothetical protein